MIRAATLVSTAVFATVARASPWQAVEAWDAAHPSSSGVVGDVSQLLFADRALSQVFCVSVMQLLEDGALARALSELSRVLDPRGRMLAVVPSPLARPKRDGVGAGATVSALESAVSTLNSCLRPSMRHLSARSAAKGCHASRKRSFF